jgi:putative endonuclease
VSPEAPFGAKGDDAVHYVYLIRSQTDLTRRYIGYTSDLKARLAAHNRGESVHTSKYIPWQLETYLAFDSKHTAIDFESYLKSGSGQAFANKRLWKTEKLEQQ